MSKWIALFVLIISGSILGYFYYELENVTSDTPVIIPVVNTHALRVYHSFNSGEHRYAGEIKLPHSCYELKVTEIASDPHDHTKYTITLTSIDRMLDVRLCVKIPTRYGFDVLITAPEGIHTSLVVDGAETPMRLIETDWQNPKGNSITTPDSSRI
jgi:hypothetical protein